MLKQLSRLKKKNLSVENAEINYESITEDLERSFSSLRSINSTFHKNTTEVFVNNNDKEDHSSANEQFQAIQLAQILEKTAFELRVYSRRKNLKFEQQRE